MSSPENTQPQLGRNEPCHCGSGKKFKRCHGVDAAPKLTTPPAVAGAGAGDDASAGPGLPFDPSQMDPAMMMQMSQALQRLPRGQMQRLQAIMQKAMAGKDVTREAAELERSLPPAFKEMMAGFSQQFGPQLGAMGQMSSPVEAEIASAASEMSLEEARRIVEQAAKEGKVSQDQAEQLLTSTEDAVEPEAARKGGIFGKFRKGG